MLCSEIVERAKKELGIEKQIKKVEDNWTTLALVFTPLPDSDITALQVRLVLGICCCCCSGTEVRLWAVLCGRPNKPLASEHTCVLHCRLQIDEAVTEVLETDNMSLQNLSGQKYVQLNSTFKDAVASWQMKLGTVDSVLQTWGDVQKKWQALESIFVGSADIRVQLPEDSKRFDAVNADYQVSSCHLL